MIEAAFRQICQEAVEAQAHYVVLMQKIPFYGGPEEGGWWGNDYRVVAYQSCSTAEEAELIRVRVLKLAEELTQQERVSHGEYCLRQTEWLDARGLEDDYLREDDGPTEFYVSVTDTIPRDECESRHWE